MADFLFCHIRDPSGLPELRDFYGSTEEKGRVEQWILKGELFGRITRLILLCLEFYKRYGKQSLGLIKKEQPNQTAGHKPAQGWLQQSPIQYAAR